MEADNSFREDSPCSADQFSLNARRTWKPREWLNGISIHTIALLRTPFCFVFHCRVGSHFPPPTLSLGAPVPQNDVLQHDFAPRAEVSSALRAGRTAGLNPSSKMLHDVGNGRCFLLSCTLWYVFYHVCVLGVVLIGLIGCYSHPTASPPTLSGGNLRVVTGSSCARPWCLLDVDSE